MRLLGRRSDDGDTWQASTRRAPRWSAGSGHLLANIIWGPPVFTGSDRMVANTPEPGGIAPMTGD